MRSHEVVHPAERLHHGILWRLHPLLAADANHVCRGEVSDDRGSSPLGLGSHHPLAVQAQDIQVDLPGAPQPHLLQLLQQEKLLLPDRPPGLHLGPPTETVAANAAQGEERPVVRVLTHRLRVCHHHQELFRPRHRDVPPAKVREEPQISLCFEVKVVGLGPDATGDDGALLSSLEELHRAHLDLAQTLRREELLDLQHLSLVRGDYANLLLWHVLLRVDFNAVVQDLHALVRVVEARPPLVPAL